MMPPRSTDGQDKISVMQLCDSLDAGGMERVAVNLANSLPRERFDSHLCTTRRDGPLSDLVSPDVHRLCLQRTQRFAIRPLRTLVGYIREHQIQILHAHGTSVFTGVAAGLLGSDAAILWHDHYGRDSIAKRNPLPYRLAATKMAGVIAVNQSLADWSQKHLKIPQGRLWYVPNFVLSPLMQAGNPDLPGTTGARIVCVSNLRPQKDHYTLLRAVQLVAREFPSVHLLLVGEANDAQYAAAVQREIADDGLSNQVSWLGSRTDVPEILRACDIGVLSSASEGLPLALIEYGMMGLPAVATNVGQCEEVLDGGRAGLLVPRRDPERLADAILSLLRSPERRRQLGDSFRQRVRSTYSAEAVLQRICAIYSQILGNHRAPK